MSGEILHIVKFNIPRNYLNGIASEISATGSDEPINPNILCYVSVKIITTLSITLYKLETTPSVRTSTLSPEWHVAI